MPHQTTPLRKDAQRSREAILDAAEALLASDPQASFAAIAHQAGVGQATVYRHFADRRELITVLLEASMDRLEAVAEGRPVEASSFADLLGAAAAEQARCQGLMSVIRHGEVPTSRLEELRLRVLELFRQPLAAAKQAGGVRPDLDIEDVPLLLAMVDGALAGFEGQAAREAAAARALELIAEGFRPTRS